MKEKRKIEALTLLRGLLGHGVRPTMRDTGLAVKEVQELLDEELIVLADTGRKDVPDPDRYVLCELTDKAQAFLAARGSHPMTRLELCTPPRSVPSRIAAATANILWDLMKVASGVLLGWWLKKHFP